MSKLKIVLNGGLKGCCTTYTAAQMKSYTNMWFDDMEDLEYSIIDIVEDYWESEPLAELTYKHLKDRIFPLTYYNDVLVFIGRFLDKDDIIKIINDPQPITEELILDIVKQLKENHIDYDIIE